MSAPASVFWDEPDVYSFSSGGPTHIRADHGSVH